MNKTNKSSALQHSGKKDNNKAASGLKEAVSDAVDIDPKMLHLLVCPLTKHSLELDAKKCELKSKAARLAYPIRGGVPILLPSEARALKDDEL